MFDFVDGGPRKEVIESQMVELQKSYDLVSEMWKTCNHNQDKKF